MDVNWQVAYTILRELGHTDGDIANLARVSRPVVNRVLKGEYPHAHEPGYSGGCRVIKSIKQARDSGLVTDEQIKELQRPVVAPER